MWCRAWDGRLEIWLKLIIGISAVFRKNANNITEEISNELNNKCDCEWVGLLVWNCHLGSMTFTMQNQPSILILQLNTDDSWLLFKERFGLALEGWWGIALACGDSALAWTLLCSATAAELWGRFQGLHLDWDRGILYLIAEVNS